MSANASVARMIPRGELHPSETNPRKSFPAESLLELAASVRANGVLSPLTVRPRAGKKGGFEIVLGERRWRASEGVSAEVPCVVREDLSDDRVLELQVAENVQREDLHPIEEADAFAELRRRGRTLEAIGEAVGKPAAHVARRLKLTELVPAARKACLDGRLSASAALHLACVPDKGLQKKALDALLKEKDLTVRTALRIIKTGFTLPLASAGFPVDDAELVPKAGSCAACPKRAGNQPHLFGADEADVCTDPTCYEAKQEAFWLRREKEVRDAGGRVLSAAEAKAAFPHIWQPTHVSNEWVRPDDPCYDDPRARTYGRLLSGAKERPAVVLARNPHSGRAEELLSLKEAKEALRETFAAVKGSAAKQIVERLTPRVGSDADKRANARRRAEEKRTLEVLRLTAGEVVRKAEGAMKLRPFLELWAALLVRRGNVSFVLERRGLEARAGVLDAKGLEDLNVGELLGLAFELSVEGVLFPRWGGTPAELKRTCDLLKVDMKAVKKLAREAEEAAARREAAKGKKAAAAEKPKKKAGKKKGGAR